MEQSIFVSSKLFGNVRFSLLSTTSQVNAVAQLTLRRRKLYPNANDDFC